MSDIWDQFQGAPVGEGGDYPEAFKFNAPGDAIAGTITFVRVVTFTNPERRVPELYIATDDGTTRSILAGQVQLQRKLAELRPVVGDRIAIRLDRIEPRGGGKTLKHFDVAHKPGNTAPFTADPVPVKQPAPVTASVAASDLL